MHPYFLCQLCQITLFQIPLYLMKQTHFGRLLMFMFATPQKNGKVNGSIYLICNAKTAIFVPLLRNAFVCMQILRIWYGPERSVVLPPP